MKSGSSYLHQVELVLCKDESLNSIRFRVQTSSIRHGTSGKHLETGLHNRPDIESSSIYARLGPETRSFFPRPAVQTHDKHSRNIAEGGAEKRTYMQAMIQSDSINRRSKSCTYKVKAWQGG